MIGKCIWVEYWFSIFRELELSGWLYVSSLPDMCPSESSKYYWVVLFANIIEWSCLHCQILSLVCIVRERECPPVKNARLVSHFLSTILTQRLRCEHLNASHLNYNISQIFCCFNVICLKTLWQLTSLQTFNIGCVSLVILYFSNER